MCVVGRDWEKNWEHFKKINWLYKNIHKPIVGLSHMLTDRYRKWDIALNGPHFIAHIAKKGTQITAH